MNKKVEIAKKYYKKVVNCFLKTTHVFSSKSNNFYTDTQICEELCFPLSIFGREKHTMKLQFTPGIFFFIHLNARTKN